MKTFTRDILAVSRPLAGGLHSSSCRGRVDVRSPGHSAQGRAARRVWAPASRLPLTDPAESATVHNEDFVLLSIFLDRKETSVLFLPLASSLLFKMAKVITIQHGILLNKQEQNLEKPPLIIKINPVGTNP